MKPSENNNISRLSLWKWTDSSKPGICDYCAEEKKRTLVLDGDTICDTCYTEQTGEATK